MSQWIPFAAVTPQSSQQNGALPPMPSTSQPIPPAQPTNFPEATCISGTAGSRELWYVCPIFLRLTHLNPTPLQEFGIDIIGEDNKTTIHHKVAAHVEAIPTSASLPPNIQANSRRAWLGVSAPKPTTLPPIAPSHAFTTSLNHLCTHTRICRARKPRTPAPPPMRSQQASTTSAHTPASVAPANPEPLHLPQSTLAFLLQARVMLTQVVAHSSQYDVSVLILLRAALRAT
ncbi:hypothetical protein F4604DRAFT_1945941 [Suillus subluteus]|nr:hypothetical protein F4604DRAFT_1945941 [Suillus subluteus]